MTRSGGVRVVIAVAILVALLVAGRRLGAEIPRFTAAVDALGIWGPVVFIATYVVACVAFAPASLLTLAAGALFGVVKGTIVAFTGATLGSLAAFLVARYVARDWVAHRFSRDARLVALDRAIGEQGRRIVFLLRLSPVIPFNVLNYALGVTEVRAIDFLIASLGMIPGTLLYVYSGHVAKVVAGASGTPPRGPAFYAVLGLGLVATAVVTVIVTRLAKRALGAASSASPPPSASASHSDT